MEKINVNVYNKGKNELPTYSTPLSAGFDLKANLGDKDTKYLGNQKWKVFDDGHIMLYNGGRILIPTGLHVAIPDGYELQVRPRSGLALKEGITVLNTPGTVDCFSEDSLIKTENGDINIKNLKINDIVLSVNDNLEIEKDVIVSIVDKGKLNILIIETEDGVLEVTENTLVYTDRGLIYAKELNENDNIIHF